MKKIKIRLRVPKNGKKLRFVWVGFRSLEKVEPRFVRSGGFLNSEEWKIKIRSGGFSNSEVQKRTKIRKFQVDFRRSEKKEPRFVSSGGLPSYGERKKIKIHLGGFPMNG
ncbi:hypothetical protein RirG_181500 [Rhizophagus irregularis DAOM 197198w]|uniref:Uncharacterized protein n=1 Tax=Rhizophagus irregularis (strain DAOM 197198w) TaxID=1432141 RepID=A0A015KKM5_RHIIW|nr:hypothetical protein RirG_181500 [Rhizophagus irregularis DAOM 197198w]